jgi:hypothetical protein
MRAMRVFFSHASEDKPVVEQVYRRVVDAYPAVQPWLDRYQIVGGQDLIERIAAGIEVADKFLVFLSEASVDKPWVRAELRQALMAEINGVKPEFIVPVKIGAISCFPPFIESKYYIDLESQTEDEWLAEIHAAITGVRRAFSAEAEENLRVTREPIADEPNALAVLFEARFWAEPVAFRISTSAPIVARQYQLIPPQRGGSLNYALAEHDHAYAVALPDKRLTPTQRFAMLMKFEPGADLTRVITSVERWDGVGTTQSGMAFLT